MNVAKLLAMSTTMDIVLDLDISQVIIESDSLEVILTILSSPDESHPYIDVVMSILRREITIVTLGSFIALGS